MRALQAGIGTVSQDVISRWLPGLQRAVPSAPLDEVLTKHVNALNLAKLYQQKVQFVKRGLPSHEAS